MRKGEAGEDPLASEAPLHLQQLNGLDDAEVRQSLTERRVGQIDERSHIVLLLDGDTAIQSQAPQDLFGAHVAHGVGRVPVSKRDALLDVAAPNNEPTREDVPKREEEQLTDRRLAVDPVRLGGRSRRHGTQDAAARPRNNGVKLNDATALRRQGGAAEVIPVRFGGLIG